MKRFVLCLLFAALTLSLCSCALLTTRYIIANNETVDDVTLNESIDNVNDSVVLDCPKEYTEQDILSMFAAKAKSNWTIIDSERINDIDGSRIGAVLYVDRETNFANVAFLKEDGYFSSCGVYAKVTGSSQMPRLEYLGNGTVAFMIVTEEEQELQCKITFSESEDGRNINFIVETDD